MAYTKITKIKSTPELSIRYYKSDKIEELGEKKYEDFINSNKEKYIFIDEENNSIFYKTISTALNCSLDSVHNQMKNIRLMYDKDNNNLMYEIKQNFGVLNLSPELAHEIGIKFAEKYLNKYQVVVSTHCNTDYVHNHIYFNSVSFLDGKKFNDCLKTIKEIREISDSLCLEYNLPIIENTKNFDLVFYKDENNKVKFFEPTDRKRKIQKGKFSNLNDYRNTVSFENKDFYKKTNINDIKNDIKEILLYVNSYESLLSELKKRGYEIRSKKKNGEYLKYIAFKAKGHLKFTRDKSLGEEFTREFLEKYFKDSIQKEYDDNRFELIIDNVDNENKNMQRSLIEKIIIKNIDDINYALYEKRYDYKKTKDYFLKCIDNNIKTLNFVENKNIKTFSDINNMFIDLINKKSEIIGQIKKSDDKINSMNILKNIIIKYQEGDKIDKKSFYLLKQNILLDLDKQNDYLRIIDGFNLRLNELNKNIELIDIQIRNLDACVRNLKRIDEENNFYSKEFDLYYNLKENFKNDQEKQNKKVQKEKTKGR